MKTSAESDQEIPPGHRPHLQEAGFLLMPDQEDELVAGMEEIERGESVTVEQLLVSLRN